jgi:hypothetical protein
MGGASGRYYSLLVSEIEDVAEVMLLKTQTILFTMQALILDERLHKIPPSEHATLVCHSSTSLPIKRSAFFLSFSAFIATS